MSGILDGKVAVVTGGGTGIGAATVRLFAEEGAKVVVAGRRKGPIAAVAREVSGLAVAADVTVESEVSALFKACDTAYGRLDVLVNNAGVSGPTANIEDTDAAEWDAVFAANVRGVFLCIKHAVPLLKRQGGAIINMSSVAGLQSKPRRAAYAASKAAVLRITEAVAYELGVHGIRVNALCPGAVSTGMWDHILAERAKERGVTPEEHLRKSASATGGLRRILAPEEIARAALFLASDAASAMTGEYVALDPRRL